MSTRNDGVHAALRRMLANGPLMALPKRPADQQLIARLAASQLVTERDYREREINEALERWLATFVAPHGIDHVTVRRMLVDLRLLVRDKAGTVYRLNQRRTSRVNADPARVLADMAAERSKRKAEHAA
jgi:hypothetical protein